MKILVTGVTGQLGYDVCRELEKRGIEHLGVSSKDFDITDFDMTMRYIKNYKPDAIIHCSAWTAVDKAEENIETATRVNADGTRNIAMACRSTGSKMMYISTDYVFPGDGNDYYEVDDATGPIGVYGESKLKGETAVRELLSEYFIVRISWVFGINGNNFVKTMLRLAETRDTINVVCDQIGSPTYTADLAILLCDMINTNKYGVYHATNEGICSWAEFANAIFKIAGKKVTVNPILSVDYPTAARRPLNSRLSKKSLDENGFKRLPLWRDALRRYVAELNL